MAKSKKILSPGWEELKERIKGKTDLKKKINSDSVSKFNTSHYKRLLGDSYAVWL